MPVYRIFTWNMQRGRSIIAAPYSSENKVLQAKARRQMIEALCATSHFGFVTEPGSDLRGAVTTPNQTSLLLPEGMGYWNSSPLEDNQDDGNACRNLLFSKEILTPVNLNYTSGGDNAFRYPAAGYYQINGARILLVTLHATSSYTAHANANGLLDAFDESAFARFYADAVIIGGDMNSNSRHFSMPGTATHQSDHILDGFVCERYDGEDIEAVAHIPLIQTSYSAMQRKLVIADPSHTIPIGYYVRESDSGHWARVSDHAPVLAELHVDIINTASSSE